MKIGVSANRTRSTGARPGDSPRVDTQRTVLTSLGVGTERGRVWRAGERAGMNHCTESMNLSRMYSMVEDMVNVTEV